MKPNYVLFQDWQANKGNLKGRVILVLFRIARLLRNSSPPIMILGIPFLVTYRIMIEWILGIEIPWNLELGENAKLYHGQALVINDNSKIGANVTIRHSTTIGAKVAKDGRSLAPRIGNNVDIGSNVVILGSVSIGDNAIIGAGSVVVKDVEAGTVVAGNPAKAVRSTN